MLEDKMNSSIDEYEKLNHNSIRYGMLLALSIGVVKVAIGLSSNSLAVLSSSIDSFVDFAIETINFVLIKKASDPRNDTYNYGLGKLEGISSIINAILLLLGGLYVAYLSFERFLSGGDIDIDLGISMPIMMAVTALTFLFTLYLKKVYDKTKNIIIFANYSHYKIDVVMNLGVLVSLLLIYMTGAKSIDLLVGFAISLYIIRASYFVAQQGFDEIIDKALDKDTVSRIIEIVDSKEKIVSHHELRTRKSGVYHYVDLHIVFGDRKISLYDAHEVSDEVEKEIKMIDSSKKWIITLHLDPEDDTHNIKH